MNEYGDFLVTMHIKGVEYTDWFNGETLESVLRRLWDWGVTHGEIVDERNSYHTFEMSYNDGCIVVDDKYKLYTAMMRVG